MFGDDRDTIYKTSYVDDELTAEVFGTGVTAEDAAETELSVYNVNKFAYDTVYGPWLSASGIPKITHSIFVSRPARACRSIQPCWRSAVRTNSVVSSR